MITKGMSPCANVSSTLYYYGTTFDHRNKGGDDQSRHLNIPPHTYQETSNDISQFLRSQRTLYESNTSHSGHSPPSQHLETTIQTPYNSPRPPTLDTPFILFSHNINGIKQNSTKFLTLVQHCTSKNADVIGISETNLQRRTGELWNAPISKNSDPTLEHWHGFWTDKDDKIKGSGVAILLNKKWIKHVGSIKRISQYYIEITLFFKKCQFTIGQLYMPPNDHHTQGIITNHITKSYLNATKPFRYFLLMGDLNSFPDQTLDYSGPNH